MTRNTDRILTTHAGSLPRPDDLIEMMWARMDGQQVDAEELEGRIESAVAEVGQKQRDAGVDIVMTASLRSYDGVAGYSLAQGQ